MSDMIRYSTTETAALIRLRLKEVFPGVKFGVRSKKYSGGSSIRVSWVDGPTTKDVDAVVEFFEGAVFDGMIDLKSYVTKEDANGTPIRFGVDYVFTERSYSTEFLTEILKQHPTPDVVVKPPTKFQGAWFDKTVTGWSRDMQDNIDHLRRVAGETTAYIKPEETPTTGYSPDVFVGEYKGHPTLTLPLDDKGFSFGVRKAQAILTYLEDIKRFVEENS